MPPPLRKSKVSKMSDVELGERRDALVARLKDVENQLASNNRTNGYGDRMTDAEYHQWRENVLVVLRCTNKDLATIKAEMKRRNPNRPQSMDWLTAAVAATEIGTDAIELSSEDLDERMEDCLEVVDLLRESWRRCQGER